MGNIAHIPVGGGVFRIWIFAALVDLKKQLLCLFVMAEPEAEGAFLRDILKILLQAPVADLWGIVCGQPSRFAQL